VLDKSVWVVNALLLVDFPWRAARRNAARQQSSSAALSAITAAVVGVVLNLAVWFAIHNVFRETIPVRAFPLSFVRLISQASIPGRSRCRLQQRSRSSAFRVGMMPTYSFPARRNRVSNTWNGGEGRPQALTGMRKAMRVLSGVLFVGAVVWTHLFVDGVNLCNARNGFGGGASPRSAILKNSRLRWLQQKPIVILSAGSFLYGA
jgi:hypothetical protein